MEDTNHFTMKTIKKSTSISTETQYPKFELRRTGEDLTDHHGIDWIYLHCPHCNSHSRFISQYTIVVELPIDDIGVSTKDFHSLAACENCSDIVYIKCFEHDFDPDWWFGYEYHHPQATFTLTETELPTLIYRSFLESHKCLQAGAYLATAVMCRRTIEALLYDKGVDKKLNLAKGIQKLANEMKFHESMINIADIVRLIGNIGAHADESANIEKSQAEEIHKLTERLIEMIYIIPVQIQKIKEKHLQMAKKDTHGMPKE